MTNKICKFSVYKDFKKKLFQVKAEAAWVFVGQVGMALGGLFSIKILTHVLSPSEFGRLAIANTIILLVSANLFGPLVQGFMRFWSISQDRGEIDLFIATLRNFTKKLIYIVALLASILTLVSAILYGKSWAVILGLSLIVGTISGLVMVKLNVLVAARKRKIVAIVNTLNSFLKPIIAACLVLFIISNSETAITGYILAAIIILFIVSYYYKKNINEVSQSCNVHLNKTKKHNSLGKEIIKFSWPFYVWGIFSWIHQSCDRWALQTYHGSDVVGAFFVVTQLALYPLIFGSNFLSTFFVPIVYERAGNLNSGDSIKAANRIILVMTFCFIIGALLLIIIFSFFHHFLVLVISNSKYVEYSYLLPWLTISWSFFYLGQTLSTFGMLANKPFLNIPPIIVSGLIAVTTTFFLSSLYGPTGVVWGLGISGFVYALWFLVIAVRLRN